MKIMISGSRIITNFKYVYQILDEFYAGHQGPLTLLLGGARGVDAAALAWAKKNKVDFLEFPAKWETGGQEAGLERNTDMVEQADGAIIIWDGKSSGSYDARLKCRNAGVSFVEVVVPPDKLFAKTKPKVVPDKFTNNVMDFLKTR